MKFILFLTISTFSYNLIAACSGGEGTQSHCSAGKVCKTSGGLSYCMTKEQADKLPTTAGDSKKVIRKSREKIE